MDKGIQDGIQIFCSICSRGVIVRNESMYKCRLCGREVCRTCFDRENRLCVECVRTSRQEPKKPWQPTPLSTEIPRPPVPFEGPNRTKRGIGLAIGGMVLFAGGLIAVVFLAMPNWTGLIFGVAGVALIVFGIVSLLNN